MEKGFDSRIYVKAQSQEVLKRVRKFKRLYLEWGGKLFYDDHASRVLPGYELDSKAEILKKLKGSEIVYCINAKDLQSKKVLGKEERSYEEQAMKDLKDIEEFGLKNKFVVITRFEKEEKAENFAEKLERMGKIVYFHREVPGYEKNIGKAIKSYEKQPYIPLKTNLIIISGPAGGSGKMAFALSQIYHEKKNGIQSAFAKFETFPIWNLEVNHPINIAYEAATADLGDRVMIDPYYKKAYKKTAVNYNRDIENFGILKEIIRKITGKKFPYGYRSPTDMGINMAKKGITNDSLCRKAAKEEIGRRYEEYKKEFREGKEKKTTIKRMEQILKKI